MGSSPAVCLFLTPDMKGKSCAKSHDKHSLSSPISILFLSLNITFCLGLDQSSVSCDVRSSLTSYEEVVVEAGHRFNGLRTLGYFHR